MQDNLPNIHDIKQKILFEVWKLVKQKYILFNEVDIDWELIFRSFEKELIRVESYRSLYEMIDEMLLTLQDPHTRVIFHPHNERLGVMSATILYLNGGYYIRNTIGHGNISRGMRVISIEKQPVEEFVLRFQQKYMFESESARIAAFISEFSKGSLGENITLKAISNSGVEVEERITFRTVEDNIKNYDNSDILSKFNFCYIKEFENVGYVKIMSFRVKNIADNFSSAIEQLNEMKSLIIDIRGNDGGNIESASKAVGTILKKNTTLGYQVRRRAGGGYSEFENPKKIVIRAAGRHLHFSKIVLLCDEFTMSASEFIFLETLKASDENIIIVGKKTGGVINGASIYTLFDGAKIQVTTSKFINSDGNQIAAGGIYPHVEIENTDRYITDNQDEQLEFAINLCKTA